jgi:hypothetical protein
LPARLESIELHQFKVVAIEPRLCATTAHVRAVPELSFERYFKVELVTLRERTRKVTQL